MLEGITMEDRLRLVRFVCAFAWADLRVRQAERTYIDRLMDHFEVPESHRAEAQEWIKRPPDPEDVDPASIPLEHRELFLDAIRGLITSDDAISEEELETFHLLEDLLSAQPPADA